MKVRYRKTITKEITAEVTADNLKEAKAAIESGLTRRVSSHCVDEKDDFGSVETIDEGEKVQVVLSPEQKEFVRESTKGNSVSPEEFVGYAFEEGLETMKNDGS